MGANSRMFNKKLLAAAVSSCVLASTATVAQENQIEEVVVTGMRASLERSVDIKRESSGVVDAISAEDIGKFPDSNLAESLQRITGVSIDRQNGEGFQVTVRGFGPQYNLVTINGRSMPAGQLNPEGGLINQRSFDMSNLASESISGVEVYKTGKANVASGGIGSTINIKTSRPMDTEGFNASIGAKAVHDTTVVAGNEVTPELSGIFSWSNDTFGASISGSYQERDSMNAGLRPNIGNGWNNISEPYTAYVDGLSPTDLDGDGVIDGDDEELYVIDGSIANGLMRDASGNILAVVENAPAVGQQVSFPNGPAYYRADFERVRENAQAVFQYQPTDDLTATLDYTYARQESRMVRSGTSYWFGGTFPTKGVQFTENAPAASPVRWWTENPSGVPRDVAVGIQQTHVENTLRSTGLNVEWDATDRLSLTFDAHNSSTKSLPGPGSVSNNFNASIGYQGVYQQGLDFSGDLPLLVGVYQDDHPSYLPHTGGATPGKIELDDLSSTVGQMNYDRIWVELDQYKVEGEFEFSDDFGIDFGVDRTKFNSEQASMGGQNITLAGGWSATNQGDVPAGLVHEINYADYFDGYRTELSAESREWFERVQTQPTDPDVSAPPIEGALQGWTTGNVSALAESMWAAAGEPFQPNSPDGINRKLTEEITAFYIQGDLHLELGGMPFDILGGLRYETTDVTSDALIAATEITWQGDNDFGTGSDPANAERFVYTHSYNHLLPSLDMSLGLNDDLITRLSYSKTIARADYDQLSQGVSNIGGPVNGPTLLGGRPGGAENGSVSLEPIESNNIDISVEWYFGDASYASVGYFYKDVPNFIGIQTVQEPALYTRDPSNGPRAIAARQALIDGGYEVSQQNLFAMVVSMAEPVNPADLSEGYIGCTGEDFCGQAFDESNYTAVEAGADIQAIYSGEDQDPISTLNSNTPVNANDANLSGLEFAVQHFFGDSGFGVAANYTYVDGSIEFDNTADPQTGTQFALVGLSDSANLIGMYEKDKWQARVTYNWRDEFLDSANIGTQEPRYTEAYQQVDFNVSYSFTDAFTVGLEGLNILGEDRRTFGRNKNQALRLEVYKPRYALSARYNF